MNTLSERNKELLTRGAKITGSFKEAFEYSFEELYIGEADEIKEFCKFLDEEVGGASSHNIDKLFLAFKNPDDAELKEFKESIKAKIREINDMMR